MSKKLFGTDGVRGIANQHLTPELAFQLGQAAARWLREKHHPLRVAMVRDTRRSGPMLGAAMVAGLTSMGVDVAALGVAPSPAASFLVRHDIYFLGIVISASHNPAADNGIKIFGADGRKLPDAEEARMEELLNEPLPGRPIGIGVGQLFQDSSPLEAYTRSLLERVPEGLSGLKVVLDCAHGAGYEIGPRVLRELGAEVVLVGAEPDGMNINAEGGATRPSLIQELTAHHGAHLGVAFDGDADRAVFSDERGRLINGDRTMALWARHWMREGKLDPKTVVATVMTNGGMERLLASEGVQVLRTPVGDKYVSQAMAESGARIGGEQSGHIIFSDHGPTGDGLGTMLEVLRVLKREGKAASEYVDMYESWPQLMVNVGIADKSTWNHHEAVKTAFAQGEEEVRGHGRLVVRPSGTQPMVRVMVECDDIDLRDRVAERIVEALIQHAGAEIHGRVDLTHALGD